MRYFKYILILISLNCFGQKDTPITATILQISLPEVIINNKQFISIIDSLISKEKQCDYFDSTLSWGIQITDANVDFNDNPLSGPSYALEIAVESGTLNKDKLIGYFFRGKNLFTINLYTDEGVPISGLFTISSKTKMFQWLQSEPAVEQYSFWHILYTDGKLILDWTYHFPCEQTNPIKQKMDFLISEKYLMGSWEFVSAKQPTYLLPYSKKHCDVFSFYQNNNFQIFGNENTYFNGYFFIGKWKIRKNYLTLYNSGYIKHDSSFFDHPFDEKLKIITLTDSTLILYGDTARDGNFVGEYTFKKILPKPYLKYTPPENQRMMPMRREKQD